MNRRFLYTFFGVIGVGTLLSIFPLSASSSRDLDTNFLQVQGQSNLLEKMTIDALENILREEAKNLQGGGGQWQFTLEGQSMIVLTDVSNNRMRIVAPIIPANTLSPEQVQAMLVANFHSALDARYAVTNGTVVSVFVHPLSSLQERDLRSGLYQVANLASNFGSSYSSGGLGFFPERQRREALPSGEENLDI